MMGSTFLHAQSLCLLSIVMHFLLCKSESGAKLYLLYIIFCLPETLTSCANIGTHTAS
jgi:hypothetical protein